MPHFNLRNLFRRVPNALLERYFHKRNLLTDINFKQLKSTETDPIMAAWNALPDSNRRRCEAELRSIHEMANDRGTRAIVDAIHQDGFDDPKEFSQWFASLSGPLERSFRTFLDYNAQWTRVQRFLYADTIQYRKRGNLPKATAKTDPASCKQLSDAIGNYFHTMQGRGRACVVEYECADPNLIRLDPEIEIIRGM